MPSSQVLHKFKHGDLHSGSKKGPKVTNRKQAVAIMLSEKRNESAHGGRYMDKSRRGSGVLDLHGHNVVETIDHHQFPGEPEPYRPGMPGQPVPADSEPPDADTCAVLSPLERKRAGCK